jgi:riboflavin kinase/FMN adenylyltransferase
MDVIEHPYRALPPDVATAVSIGVFDGLHRGHRHLLGRLRERADALGVDTAVVTFDVHPAFVLRPESAPRILTTREQRLELFEALGIDHLYLLRFTAAWSHTTPDAFVDQLVLHLRPRSIVVGQDFHYGAFRQGSVETLREEGERDGFEVVAVELLTDEGATEPVSSTAVRRALAGGDVAGAAALLGRLFELRGEVIVGDRRGRTMGFPTANMLATSDDRAAPADGVYAGWFTRENGEQHPCAINIGRRPTFHEHAEHSLLEAHLLDFDGDLYGEHARVSFVEFLRSERRFNGVDELIDQLKKDVALSRRILGC